MKRKYNVNGMMCAACQANVTRVVSHLEGVKSCNVSLLAKNMVVEFDENILDDDKIINAVKSIGYDASIFVIETLKHIQEKRKKELHTRLVKLLTSLIFLILLMIDSMVLMMFIKWPSMDQQGYGVITLIETLVQIVLLLPIIIINFHYFTSGFKALFKGHPNMNSLIALGSSISILYSLFATSMVIYGVSLGGDMGEAGHEIVMTYSMNLYFESAGMILVFVSIGKYFELKATNKTSESIASLLALTPDTSHIVKNGEIVEIATENLQVDDIVFVKPGESIPTDGIISYGFANIDESAITGESIPIYKTLGDKVIGGTINTDSSFQFKVTSVGKDTTIAQIISLVEEASESKAPIARLADKIASIFVPTVILIAICVFTIWMCIFNFANIALPSGYSSSLSASLNYAITVLVVSCPCALGLATPVAIMVGTGKGAENGILIKSATAFEQLKKVDYVLFDKTGTITNGEMSFVDMKTYGVHENDILQKVASIEFYSEHPLSKAIVSESKKRNLELSEIKDFISIPGKGVRGNNYLIGNKTLMDENNISVTHLENDFNEFANQGLITLFVAKDNEVIALIAIGDTIKDNAFKTIELLKKQHKNVAIVTGDNEKTASFVAKKLGIDRVFAQALPNEKEAIIQQLQKEGHIVAFIGDGINDAPALTRADIGIAIGAGSDIALESADIILVRSNPLDVISAIELSQKVVRNIKENLAWAFIYNILLIPLAAGILTPLNVVMTPMYGSLAMSLSSVTVVLNALRLRLYKTKGE